jgi:hypothetical protein
MKAHISEKISSLQKHLEKVQQMTPKSSTHAAWIELELKRTRRKLEELKLT